MDKLLLTDEELRKVIPGYCDYIHDSDGEIDWTKAPTFSSGAVTHIHRDIAKAALAKATPILIKQGRQEAFNWLEKYFMDMGKIGDLPTIEAMKKWMEE